MVMDMNAAFIVVCITGQKLAWIIMDYVRSEADSTPASLILAKLQLFVDFLSPKCSTLLAAFQLEWIFIGAT